MRTICFLFIHFAYLQQLVHSSSGKFYIYDDWPNELNDVWPPENTILKADAGYSHEFRGNNGAGLAINRSLGMFQTWQFSLYKLLINRMLHSSHRTMNPSEANAFIIPFDLGVHSHIDHSTGQMRLASPHGWTAIQLLQKAQKNTTFWKRNGHDHFIIFGITAYQMVGIGVKVFFMGICQNCSVLTIETSPTLTAIPGRSKKHWFAQPYPSFFHVIENMTQFPWTYNPQYTRTITALFIGSVKTKNPKSNSLRRKLHEQCKKSESSMCIWEKTAHACNGVLNQTSALYLFTSSIFCLAPPGDSLTRKSLFDSLLSGCIPVLFIKASLTQYSWHLTREEVELVSVYIPMRDIIKGGVNFMDRLAEISVTELQRKQRAIALIAPRLQYAIVPDYITRNTHDKSSIVIWTPPFPDAASIAINHVVNLQTIEPINGYSELDLFIQKKRQIFLMHNDEEFTGYPSKGEFNESIAIQEGLVHLAEKSKNKRSRKSGSF